MLSLKMKKLPNRALHPTAADMPMSGRG